MTSFEIKLTEKILSSLNNDLSIHQDSAFDKEIFKRKKTLLKTNWKDRLISKFTQNYYNPSWAVKFAIERLLELKKDLNYFEFCFNILEDDNSKTILIELIALRICGSSKVQLSIETDTYENYHQIVSKLEDKKTFLQADFRGWRLNLFDLNEIGYNKKLYCRVFPVVTFFLQEQYANIDNHIQVEENDIVIDAGGCWGDTALYFSEKAKKGKVYSFEFIKSNIEIFKKNISLNPEADNIEIIDKPLWSRETDFFVLDNGPASQVSDVKKEGFNEQVKSITIDQFSKNKKLTSIDFIKMDIEGAELDALKGGEDTLKTYKPKLAIALYHNSLDFESIPKYIDSLNLGYKFHLGHATPGLNETILFAKVY